jgi:hypothetical protein
MSLKTMVRQAPRVPLPLVFTVRKRTVANVDSIGLVSWYRVQVESLSPSLCESCRRFDSRFFFAEQREASGVQGAAMSPLVAGMDAAKS